MEDTKWLFLVRTLLHGCIGCAYEMLEHRRSCLVHCSDGWDRTAQMSALIQVMLDPYARTINGFCIVIQKDWRVRCVPWRTACSGWRNVCRFVLLYAGRARAVAAQPVESKERVRNASLAARACPCVRAPCVRACVHACVRACVRACVPVCVIVRVAPWACAG